jgi:enoyl-CoA hydratase/carnithine racemase
MTELVTCAILESDATGGARIADVRLNRPDKLNSLTLDLLDALQATAESLAGDLDLRGVLLSGEGRSFCAGLDFGSVLGEPERFRTVFEPDTDRGTNLYQEAPWAWRRLDVPVVAAIHGHCLGGGLQIALAADYRFTTADAKWSVLEAKWGLVPDMSGVQALSELVRIDVAKRLAMTGEMFSGERAAELGLASEVAEDPYAEGLALLAQIATRSPDSVAGTKRLFDDTWHAEARTTFERERAEQAILLGAPNTAVAQHRSLGGEDRAYGPRLS